MGKKNQTKLAGNTGESAFSIKADTVCNKSKNCKNETSSFAKLKTLCGLKKDFDESEAYRKIREIYEKTVEMQRNAKRKNQEIKKQFAELRERIENSAHFLDKTREHLEGIIKYLYKNNMLSTNSRLKLEAFMENYNINNYEFERQIREVDKKMSSLDVILLNKKYKQHF